MTPPTITESDIYSKLLSSVRRRPSNVENRTLEEEAESDRGRVLFSAPFRRLQSKAQVFSLETNASVRSRLTHSLEVATLGRQIAQEAIRFLGPDRVRKLGIHGNERALITFVDTACLIHDLGNPPFGHFGEAAISKWFQTNRHKIDIGGLGGTIKGLWDHHYTDFENFDGNPQSFRIVSKLQETGYGMLCGLNLTATTLASIVKYPYCSSNRPTKENGRKINKYGYFRTEEEIGKEVWMTLGLGENIRHPLVTLMEAADDIAYCLSDIEDGIEKGLIEIGDFTQHVREKSAHYIGHPVFGKMLAPPEVDRRSLHYYLDALDANARNRRTTSGAVNNREMNPFFDLRNLVTRHLCEYAGQEFAARHDKMVTGRDIDPLLIEDNGGAYLETFKEFAVSRLYNSSIVRQREISADRIVTGILSAYLTLMQCRESRFRAILECKSRDDKGDAITVETSLASRLPEKAMAVYRASTEAAIADPNQDAATREVLEKVYRIRLMIDYISGMTDDFALRTFQLISGVAT